MSPDLVTPSEARSTARELFLLLHRGHVEWFNVAWEALAGGEHIKNPTDVWKTLPGLGAAGGPDLATQQMARDFAAMAATFLIESPTARSALLARLKEACTKRGHAKPIRQWLAQAAQEMLPRSEGESTSTSQASLQAALGDPSTYAVWHLEAHDLVCGEPERYDSKAVATRFWDRRRDYDLFIYDRSVFAPKQRGNHGDEIELNEEQYRALVALLLCKGNPLTPAVLYKVASRNQGLVQGNNEADILTSHLKSLVSRLRKQLSSAVPALKIPDKRKLEGYAIKGAFRVCVVLPVADASSFQQLLAGN